MKITLRNNLLFTSMLICFKEAVIEIDNILIDTGSATTVIAVDILSKIGIKPEPTDMIRTIRGVGGIEAVFSRTIDYLQVNEFKITKFEIEISGMDYGFSINGILGMDFLLLAGGVINLNTLEMDLTKKN